MVRKYFFVMSPFTEIGVVLVTLCYLCPKPHWILIKTTFPNRPVFAVHSAHNKGWFVLWTEDRQFSHDFTLPSHQSWASNHNFPIKSQSQTKMIGFFSNNSLFFDIDFDCDCHLVPLPSFKSFLLPIWA